MTTWVGAPDAVAAIYAIDATGSFSTILPPASNPIYNSAPLWIPAPTPGNLINLSSGVAI